MSEASTSLAESIVIGFIYLIGIVLTPVWLLGAFFFAAYAGDAGKTPTESLVFVLVACVGAASPALLFVYVLAEKLWKLVARAKRASAKPLDAASPEK